MFARPSLRLRDKRLDTRIPVHIETVVCSSTSGRRRLIITDLSASGCQVTQPLHWGIGELLVITLPTLAPRGARVRWQSSSATGLRFEERLNSFVISHLAEKFRDFDRE